LEGRCKYYLQGADVEAQIEAVLALLDDEVYDIARSADISVASTPSVVLEGFRKIFGSSEHHWVLQSDIQRRFQQPRKATNDL
uniref:NAD(P)-dependent oxidoreductase n=1 Tax=Schistocephalus solidus TaxID=70667 RepID=A0A183TUC1_SCHSO